jgi:hypothetical protein
MRRRARRSLAVTPLRRLAKTSGVALLPESIKWIKRGGSGGLVWRELTGILIRFGKAIGPAFQLGQNTLANTTNQVGDIFGGSLEQAGRVESFNTNMAMNRYNSVLNNNAALQSAGMQAGAAGQAGMMGMVGSGVGAAVGIAGIGIAI